MLEKKSSTVFNKNSEERRRKRTKLLFVAFLAILVILSGCIAFLRKPAFQINDISIIGTRSLDPQIVRKTALLFVQGNHMMIIPRTNTLLFSKSGMKEFLMNEIPGITNASIEFTHRNLITITITEKQPDSVWCRVSECYFIDTTGMIYEPSPEFSDGVFTVFTGSTIPVDTTPIKERFVPANLFIALKEMLAGIKKYPFSVVGVDLQEAGDIAIRVDRIKDMNVNSRAQILITKETGVQSIFESMNLLLKNDDFTTILSSKGDTLQYLDFRFPGKIYYKFNP